MSMVRCDADEHFYDDSKHSSCPFCVRNRGENKKTILISPKMSSNDVEITEKTIAPWQKKISSTHDKNKIQERGSEYSDVPVAGWLVIVDGNHKGEDYKIIPGINTIGRDHHNTIAITNNDQEISREKHCIIEFDTKNKKFYVERGSMTTYLNDSRVGGDGTELSAKDIIEIGATKLQFIPFCSVEFCWNI